MNIAFPAFFIFCLILPGFIFLRSFSRKENTSIDHKGLDSSSAWAIFLSASFHLIWWLLTSLFNLEIRYDICMKLLTSVKLVKDELYIITESIPLIIAYFLSMFITTFLLGKLTQKILTHYCPYKESYFSFDTPWYYELKGLISKELCADFTKVSCLVDLKEGSYLYYGILKEFYLNKDGSLDRIVIEEASRRSLDKDERSEPENDLTYDEEVALEASNQERFYEIKGDRIILKYSDIKNINLEYYTVTETNDDEEPENLDDSEFATNSLQP